METSKKFFIGEESERFLDALELFTLFRDKLLEALVFMYGEEQGTERYMKNDQKLEDIDRIVMEYLHFNFIAEMGTGRKTVII